MIGPFHVGDRPADPLNLTVTRPDDPAPMSGFTSATVELYHPDGTTTTWSGAITATGVTSAFPSALTQPGQYKVRLALTGSGGVVERTGWAYFRVRP